MLEWGKLYSSGRSNSCQNGLSCAIHLVGTRPKPFINLDALGKYLFFFFWHPQTCILIQFVGMGWTKIYASSTKLTFFFHSVSYDCFSSINSVVYTSRTLFFVTKISLQRTRLYSVYTFPSLQDLFNLFFFSQEYNIITFLNLLTFICFFLRPLSREFMDHWDLWSNAFVHCDHDIVHPTGALRYSSQTNHRNRLSSQPVAFLPKS